MNYFPFAARWGACDGIVTSVYPPPKDDIEVKIYPNPNSGLFTVFCHSERSEESPLIIEIYDVLGEKVFTESLRFAQGDNSIDLTNQPNGIYLYRVIGENGTLVGEGKVVVER